MITIYSYYNLYVTTLPIQDFVTRAVQIAKNTTLQAVIREHILSRNHVLYSPHEPSSRWEPNSLTGLLAYFNSSFRSPHGHENTIREWNKMLLFIANSPRPITRGSNFHKAINLAEINFSHSDFSSDTLTMSTVDQGVLTPHCFDSHPKTEASMGLVTGVVSLMGTDLLSSDQINNPAGSAITEIMCGPCLL